MIIFLLLIAVFGLLILMIGIFYDSALFGCLGISMMLLAMFCSLFIALGQKDKALRDLQDGCHSRGGQVVQEICVKPSSVISVP
jgi:hypothetical protein